MMMTMITGEQHFPTVYQEGYLVQKKVRRTYVNKAGQLKDVGGASCDILLKCINISRNNL